MDKLKKKLKKYRYEITLVGTGVFIGYVVSKRSYSRKEDGIYENINAQLKNAFESYEGNFTTADGKWVYPVYSPD